MIDTDKYEGHNRENWSWGNKGSTDNGDGTIMIRPFTQLESKSGVTLLAIHHGDAKQSDLELIADAPLLLAEVKRMRAVFDSHGECHLCGFRLDEHHIGHELPCNYEEEE